MVSTPRYSSSGKALGKHAVLDPSEEIAEQRALEQQAADLAERLQLALEAGGLGTFRWDLATGKTEWDTRLEALFGLEPGEFDGTFDAWVALLHPDDIEQVRAILDEAVKGKGHYTVEHRVLWPDGTMHWLQGAGQVTVDSAGRATGAIGCTADVTARVVADQDRHRLALEAMEAVEQERIGRERLEFLGTINDALSSANSRDAVMRNVAQATVPRLGDWCSICVLPSSGGRTPDVEIAHVDPHMVRYAREVLERFGYDPDGPVGMPWVIRTGQPEFYPVITDDMISVLPASDAERDIVRALALRSSIAVPLIKKGDVLGGMQFVMSSSGRLYTRDDLALAEAVAARIASSLDNIRLSEEQRAIASALQASLLPEALPERAGVEIAVRYWATGQGVDVGGDFYDAFEVDEATMAVVVGDVCGTGPAAAAVTGLARHTIAAAAWHGDGPAAVLESLNRTMCVRGTDRFCTVVYGTLKPSSSGMEFSFACGGHPLPILADADGSVAPRGTPGTLIGVFDDVDVTTTTVTLDPGDIVVLYTDGATDVPPPHNLTAGEFADLIAQVLPNATSAEALADRLHAKLSAILPVDERGDDIALMVLRITDGER